jgi:integrase
MGRVETKHAPTVGDLIDRYQAECLQELSPRTRRDYQRHLNHLRREFGHRTACDLVPKDFADFMNVKKGKIQRNRQLAVLSAVFTKAVRRWFAIDRNVLRDVERHSSRPRDRYVSDAEYEGCKASAPLRVRLMMELALLTGQRQGDLISLQWSQVVEMPDGTNAILFEQAKTRKRLALKVTPTLEAVLDRCWQLPKGGKDGGPHVITRRCGGCYTSEGFRALWQRTINAWVKRGNKRFTFHDLRAKSASDSATVDDAYQRLGHTSIAMTKRVYDRGIRVVTPLK